MMQPTTEQLAATLAAYGLPLLRTGGAVHTLDLTPPNLIEAMVRSPEGRLAEALIALFLRFPAYATYVPALVAQFPVPLARRLQHLYTAAVYLQQLWRGVLGLYLGEIPLLPDYFGQAVWHLPHPDGHCGEASLRDLAEAMEAETGDNWLSTYQSALDLLVAHLHEEAAHVG